VVRVPPFAQVCERYGVVNRIRGLMRGN